MGFRNGGHTRKFYATQVEKIYSLLQKKVSQEDSNIDIAKYLSICDKLGEAPDPDRMPLETSDFPEEVQTAFFVFDYLQDRWEGMSGSYLGKEWSNIEFLFDLFDIQERRTVLYFIKLWENVLVNYKAEKSERKRKAEERKNSSGSAGNFTHNVRG